MPNSYQRRPICQALAHKYLVCVTSQGTIPLDFNVVLQLVAQGQHEGFDGAFGLAIH
jgi:hypothetical protein